MATLWDMLASTWPAQMGQTIAQALMAPGNAYKSTPDNPITTGQMIGPAADLAGVITSGTLAAPAVRGGAGMGIRAYHGSPYDFDKFDLSKIGTGEGAQSYGHGLYFAENPAVAADYKGKLTRQALVSNSPEANNALYYLERNNFDKKLARAEMESALGMKLPDTHSAVEAINSYNPGRMYEVNINAKPEQFLDWDKPLSRQPDYVSQILGNVDPKLERLIKKPGISSSAALNEAGIPGIKYLDQGSRGTKYWDLVHPQGGVVSFPSEKEAKVFLGRNPEYSLKPPNQTNNYVVFNPEIVDILKKYGLAGMLGGTLGLPQNSNNQVLGF